MAKPPSTIAWLRAAYASKSKLLGKRGASGCGLLVTGIAEDTQRTRADGWWRINGCITAHKHEHVRYASGFGATAWAEIKMLLQLVVFFWRGLFFNQINQAAKWNVARLKGHRFAPVLCNIRQVKL